MQIEDANNNKVKAIEVFALLVNNSGDTLRYVYNRCKDSTFFLSDNENLTVVNDTFQCPFLKNESTVILPHKYVQLRFYLQYKRPPEANFKFRIRMHLLQWTDQYNKNQPSSNKIVVADKIWSKPVVFNVSPWKEPDSTLTNQQKIAAEIVYDTLSSDQRKRYVLKIERGHISKSKVPECTDKKLMCATMPVRLSNNSNDTLEYSDMTCEWQLIFSATNREIKIPVDCTCLANYRTTFQVLPHRDTLFYVPVCFSKEAAKNKSRFKIGMTLLKISRESLFNLYDAPHLLSYVASHLLADNPQYTIWSDEIEVPRLNN